jgi:hypothetical protein
MKWFTSRALLAAALLSAVAVIPFLPAAHRRSAGLSLEVRLASSEAGHVQVYWDAGRGFHEEDSTIVPLRLSAEPVLYRLPLLPGTFQQLRFDPIDRDGTVTIAGARIVAADGRTVLDLPGARFKPLHQIESLRDLGGQLEVRVTPGGTDPQLLIPLDLPLTLHRTWGEYLTGWPVRAGSVLLLLVLALLALDRLERARPRWSGALLAWGQRPGRAIALVAALAVIVSAYPVVFLGRSYVSPNYGTVLLYDAYPTLPGYSEGQLIDNKGSDVGAIMWQHVPFSMIQHRALLRDGELPWWNRYDSAGSPLLGQGQSMFGDPLHLLVIAANGAAWSWDLKYLLAKWLFAVGLGWLVLAAVRHLPSALIVSLAAPFMGFFVYRINHPAFFSFCYAPWPLFCWLRFAQATGRRAAAGWAGGVALANLALMNSGTAKEAYVLLFVMNLAGAAVLLGGAAPGRERLAKLAGMAWVGTLFALITSPLWATFAGTLKNSHTTYDVASAFQIQPGLLLGFFDEAFYRPLTDRLRVFNPSANFLILAGFLYFVATLRHHFANRTTVALAAASLVPLGFAFGLVPADWIVRVPLLANIAHIDNCFSCALIVLWSVLAGAGFAAAARRLATREGRDDLVIAGLLLSGLVAGWVAFHQAVHRAVFGPGTTFSPLAPGQPIVISSFVWGYLVVLLVALAALAGLARLSLTKHTTSSGGFLLLWREDEQAQAAGFEDYVVRPPVRTDFHAQSDAVRWVQEAQAASPGRSVGMQNNLFPGWSAAYQLEGITGPDALMNPLYRDLTQSSPLQTLWDWRLYLSRDNLAAARPFLDFLNVRYYLDLHSDQAALGRVLKFERAGDLDVYESPTAWPRAFFTDRLGSYGNPGDLAHLIATGDGHPFAAAAAAEIAAVPALAALPHELPGRTVIPADDYALTEGSTSFEVRAPSPGVVVVTEAFWTGYSHATVDGKKAPAMRLNHAFEGVVIDTAGRHRVTFTYRPRQAPLLLALSAAGLIGLAGSGWLVWKSGPPMPIAAPPPSPENPSP